MYNNAELVGYAMCELLPEQSIIHIHQLAVMIKHQGKGVGKIVIKAISESSLEVKSIVVTTRIQNTRAQAFYKKMGFYQVNKHIKDVKCNFAYSLLLRKDL